MVVGSWAHEAGLVSYGDLGQDGLSQGHERKLGLIMGFGARHIQS